MARGGYDPCLVTAPHVYKEDGKWRMTYVSGIKWEEVNGIYQSYYHIKYAESVDGINWKREGVISVDFKSDNESNIAMSCVIKENGIYKIWYCYVLHPNKYIIGYGE